MSENPFDALDDENVVVPVNPFDAFASPAPPEFKAGPEPDLWDRVKINFQSGEQATVLGATYDASTPSRQTERRRFDEHYAAFPDYSGALEGGAAFLGQFAGMAASPENFIPGVLGYKIVNATKMAITGLRARIFAGAVDAAVINAVTDGGIQGIEIGADFRQSYDPVQHAFSTLMGAGIGGAGGAIGHGVRKYTDPEIAPLPETVAADNVALSIGEKLSQRAVESRGLGPTAKDVAPHIKTGVETIAIAKDADPSFLTKLIDQQPFKTTDELLQVSAINHQSLNDKMAQIGQKLKLVFDTAPIKTRESIERKTLQKYAGHINRVSDAARTGIVAKTVNEADQIVAEIGQTFRILDEGWNETEAGFFARKLIVVFEDGQLGEVQIWPPGMREVNEDGGHRLYEIWRDRTLPEAQRNAAFEKLKASYAEVRASLDAGFFEKSGAEAPRSDKAFVASPDDNSLAQGSAKISEATILPQEPSIHNKASLSSETAASRSISNSKNLIEQPPSGKNLGVADVDVKGGEIDEFLDMAPAGKMRGEIRRGDVAEIAAAADNVRRIQDVAHDLAKALEVTATRQGRIKGKSRVLGQYNTRSGVVRLRSLEDFDVLTHEYGHHFEVKFPGVQIGRAHV